MTDSWMWLEDLDSDRVREWVRERNEESTRVLATGPRYEQLVAEILQVLDSPDRLRRPRLRGEYLYDFWQDAQHPKGVWQRTTLDGFRANRWETLLDLDALAEAEGENWVWQDVDVLKPLYDRALLSLSRGGGDAAVVREFDLATKTFVPDGFFLPEAKSVVSWIDRDAIFVGTDYGPGTLTESGYPRIAKRWQRGTPLNSAVTVFEGQVTDVSARVWHNHSANVNFARRALTTYSGDNWVLSDDGSLTPLPVPQSAVWGVHGEWLVLRIREDWDSHKKGSLLAARFGDFLNGGKDFTVLFEPDEHTALRDWLWTRDHLIVSTLRDVHGTLTAWTPGWSSAPLMAGAEVVSTNAEHDNAYLLDTEDFLNPPTLHIGHIDGAPQVLQSEPASFDASGMATRQFFATSDDGTQVPYWLTGSGDGPVLMFGYGGFEQALTPAYNKVIGRGWLARGGTYVVANIRGGGEYGSRWHQAALREKRPRAYEDFAAVARDLVARGITTPERLGIFGRSNGGLLMGVMLTRYPELFGAIVIQVPLLDMRRYHQLLAGASWMAEYGDPDNPADWEFIERYSPYQKLAADAKYPPVLMLSSASDDRVHPGHGRKLAARLAELGHDVTFFENTDGGHAGTADNAQRAAVWGMLLNFLWQRLTPN